MPVGLTLNEARGRKSGVALFLFRVGLCFIATSMIPGCTSGVIAFPYCKVDYFETQDRTGCAVRLKSWGFCLITHPSDAGFVIGCVNQTYYFEGERSVGEVVPFADIQHPQTLRAVVSDAVRGGSWIEKRWMTMEPVAFVGQSSGAITAFNPHRMGFLIGFNHHAALRIPSDFKGVFCIDTTSGDVSPGCLYLKRECLQ